MQPFIDLAKQQDRIRERLQTRIQDVLDHGNYIMGPEVKELENVLSQYVRCQHAISCSSGTDALLLALMAYGVGPGDAILTTPFTFIATAEVITLLGATPVFVDIDPKSFNISADGIEKALNAVAKRDSAIHALPKPLLDGDIRPKGIISVDLFGLPADYGQINAIAEKHNLFVIEDGAQSFGALLNGKRSGTLAHIGCTSFFPAKPLGCYGDGGMCFTDDDRLADAMRSLRVHGKGNNKYDNVRIGINGRLDTFQAAILLEKFAIYEEELQLRQKVASVYGSLLSDYEKLTLPVVPENKLSAWAQYSILAENETLRQKIMDNLNEKDVPSVVYYPKPLHLQPALSYLGYREGDFIISEAVSRRIFSLPFYPYIQPEIQKKISEIIGMAAGSA